MERVLTLKTVKNLGTKEFNIVSYYISSFRAIFWGDLDILGRFSVFRGDVLGLFGYFGSISGVVLAILGILGRFFTVS